MRKSKKGCENMEVGKFAREDGISGLFIWCLMIVVAFLIVVVAAFVVAAVVVLLLLLSRSSEFHPPITESTQTGTAF